MVHNVERKNILKKVCNLTQFSILDYVVLDLLQDPIELSSVAHRKLFDIDVQENKRKGTK